MKDRKNIDRLFQEKFKDFEKSPNSNLWSRIETTLKEDKKDRKIVPIWWKLAGVAAVLIGFLLLGDFIFSDRFNSNSNVPVVEKDSNLEGREYGPKKFVNNGKDEPVVKDDSGSIDSQEVIDESIVNSNISSNQSSESSAENYSKDSNSDKRKNTNSAVASKVANVNSKDKTHTSNSDLELNTEVKQLNSTIDNQNSDKTGIAQANKNKTLKEETRNENGSSINSIKNQKDKSEVVVDATEKSDEANIEEEILEAVANIEEVEEIEKEEDEKLNRWNVAPNVSPVYFNTLGNGSSIDSQFNDNSKTGDITFSYGINGSYAINKKLKVRVGINRVDLGYSTKNVIVFSGVNSRAREGQQLSNIQFANGSSEQSYMSGAVISNAVAQPNVLITNPKGTLDQELGFVEIPLEIEYNILDKKIDLNVIGGFSTFFLDENKVYSNFLGDRVLLGRATNINETSYSANLGLGVNYNFTKNLDLSIEPTFKYQINTFENTSGDFRPYFIGVYSGIRFKF